MESHAQSVEDNLIDSLSFRLRPGASYVVDRKSVSYFPQGGNQYSPSGVNVMKIMLNGSDWLDPSTCKLFMNFQNDDAGAKDDPTCGRSLGYVSPIPSIVWWSDR